MMYLCILTLVGLIIEVDPPEHEYFLEEIFLGCRKYRSLVKTDTNHLAERPAVKQRSCPETNDWQATVHNNDNNYYFTASGIIGSWRSSSSQAHRIHHHHRHRFDGET